MFFVFGWTPRSVDEGLVVTTHCRVCGQPRPWHLHTVTMWISLFFFRVLPTGNEFWLRCDVCGDGFELGNSRNELIRRGDPADDPTIVEWIRGHQGSGPLDS